MIVMRYKNRIIKINDDKSVEADEFFVPIIGMIINNLGPQDGNMESAVYMQMKSKLPELQLVEMKIVQKPNFDEDTYVLY